MTILKVKNTEANSAVFKTLLLTIICLTIINWLFDHTQDPALILAINLITGIICVLVIRQFKPLLKKN